MLCLGVLHVGAGIGLCGVLCVLCMWVRALYREVVCVCVIVGVCLPMCGFS